MLFIDYAIETQVSGLLTLICMLFAFSMGIFVLIRAIKLREKYLYFFFFTIIFAFSPWFSIAFGYIYWIFSYEALPYDMHIYLNLFLVPLALLSWLYIYTDTLFPKRTKRILISLITLSIIMEIYMFYFLYFAPDAPVEALLGSVHELQPTYAGFLIIYSFCVILLVLPTGIHFSIHAIKRSNNKETQWKGRFLLTAFIFYVVEVVIDVVILNTLIIIIVFLRILLMITAILFYFGFVLPKWLKKILPL